MRRLKLTDESLRRYKGGGILPGGSFLDPLGLFKGGKSSEAAKIDSLPVPLPAKPVNSSNPEVIQAEQDYAKASLLKKSVKKTIHAGDDGGFGGTQKLGM